MRRILFLLAVAFGVLSASARSLGYGVDAFNRIVPATVANPAVFSPLSFEIDTVVFAEAVDPIRRALFAHALHVMDQFDEEFSPLARLPVDYPGTNGVDLVWAHALAVERPRAVDPAYRLAVQDLYGVEVCRAKPARGVEAWVRTMFAGANDGWSLPPLPKGNHYALHDLVAVTVRAAQTNGWKRLCPTHTVYRQPLAGGSDFYALVPKSGRPVSSIRVRLTSVTLPEILSMSKAVIDPPAPVQIALPPLEIVTTNELAGAFSYFHLPTSALKPFPPGIRPSLLRQLARFRLETPPPAPDAEPLEGPFLFFIHDPAINTIPIVGVIPGKGE